MANVRDIMQKLEEKFITCSNKEYRQAEGLSNSDLKDIYNNPYKFFNGDIVRKQTDAMRLGSAIHSMALEGAAAFNNEFAVLNKELNLRTKADKEYLEKFKADNLGKDILKPADYEVVLGVNTALKSDNFIMKMLSGGFAEKSFFSAINGINVKCRPDYIKVLKDGSLAIIDLKTTDDSSAGSFAKTAATYGYYQQAAFYSDLISGLGFKVDGFYFIAVEKQAPYYRAVYTIKEEHINTGREHYARALEMALNKEAYIGKTLLQSDIGVIQVLDLPTWIFYK